MRLSRGFAAFTNDGSSSNNPRQASGALTFRPQNDEPTPEGRGNPTSLNDEATQSAQKVRKSFIKDGHPDYSGRIKQSVSISYSSMKDFYQGLTDTDDWTTMLKNKIMTSIGKDTTSTKTKSTPTKNTESVKPVQKKLCRTMDDQMDDLPKIKEDDEPVVKTKRASKKRKATAAKDDDSASKMTAKKRD
ncbi:hypothetical protein MMC28_003423 [Mycoblastus sanguinarius]|nr:hypothetical protein [Mycoblastus sanguinarius]